MIPSSPRSLGESSDCLRQFADFFFKFRVVLAAIWKNRAQVRVKFARSRSLRNLANIRGADSCAWDNYDALPPGCDKFGEHRGSLWSAFRATGGENSLGSGLNHVSERLMQIGDLIERPVVRHRQGPCQFGQLPRSLDVNAMVFCQDAQYDAIHPRFFGISDGSLHLRELSSRIDEISCAWPDHGKNRNAKLRSHRAKGISAGCNTAERQISAEFDAVRAAALRCQRPFKSLDTDFEQAFPVHVRSPAAETTCVSLPWVQFQNIPSSPAALQPHKNRRISLGRYARCFHT